MTRADKPVSHLTQLRTKDHPANNDRSAVLVWSKPKGDTMQSVFRTSAGFMATTGHGLCLPGFYGSQQDAVDALNAETRREA